MAHHRPAPSTSLRGKQAAVQEGQFLQFLRSVGYRDELPPSTVAWLETAPVFKFLAGKLSADNFVSAQDQQEYNECMLARGPDASLYDAVGDGLSSDGGGDGGEGGGGGAAARAAETDPFLAGLTDDEVAAALQEEEVYVQRLEQQVASLRAMSGALSSTAQQAAEQQGPRYFTLKAHAGDELAAARSEAAHLNSELNATLQQLEEVSAELCKLLAYPHAWLLCAAPDRAAYEQVDSAANNQYGRATHLLDASEVAMHLHTSVSPAGPAAAAAAAVADHSSTAASGGGSLPTPRGLGGQQQQQQQASMLTPRGGQSKDWAAALQDATKKRREAHAARNTALMTEMCRQRHAFALALQDVVATSVAEAGVQAQLAAAQQVRSCSGDFAALLRQGPAAVGHLASRLMVLEGDKVALERGTVAALTVDVARLNDNHIIVGDYDRQLAKMDAAFSRRQGVLRCLLHRGAVHLLLLLLGLQELRRLAALGQELQRAAHVMEGHVAAAEARITRCVAAFKALDGAQSLSNLRPEDTFLSLLLAAAEGRFQLQDEQQPSGAAAAAAGEQQAPATPGTPSASGVLGCGGAARTPSYAPSAGLADKLQQLSSSLQQGATSLQRLLELLPQQLEQHKQSACELHRTAFPPGQPLYVPGSTSGGGGLAAAAAPPSAAGSTWGGSQSAAPSMRSTHHSTSSGGGVDAGSGQHPRPLLVLPEVAEAEAALDAGLKQLQGDANRAITKQNSMVAAGRSKEAELERRVMALFFGAPDDLAGVVDSLHKQLDQAAL